MNRRHSTGFTLIELSIAALIMALMAAVGLFYASQQVAYAQADAQADALTIIGNAVGAYETTYFNNLVNNQAVAGVANAPSPTIAELITLGLLDKSTSSTNLYGGGYAVTMAPSPAGCVGTACNIQGLVYLDKAILAQGFWPADALLGEALQRGGGNFGYSASGNPANVVGANGNWTMANPKGAVAGILGMRIGLSNFGADQFLRRDGTRPMTGNLNMGGRDLVNAQNLTAAGTLQTGTANVTGNLSAGQDIWAGQSITATQNLTVGQNITAGAAITAGTNITAGQNVKAATVQTTGVMIAGAACTPNGLQAQDGTGAPLFCVSGLWTAPGGKGAGHYVASVSPWYGLGTYNFTNLVPAADQATLQYVQVQVRIYWGSGLGGQTSNCCVYGSVLLDGNMVTELGFDTGSNENINYFSTVVPVSAGTHTLSYSQSNWNGNYAFRVIGYFAN